MDMVWLGAMARTGEIPYTAPTPAHASVAGEGEDVDLNAEDYQGEPEVLLPTQQPPSARSGSGSVDKKGKGKEKASREPSMVDITNGASFLWPPRRHITDHSHDRPRAKSAIVVVLRPTPSRPRAA